MFCCGREKKYEHVSCLPGLAQVFFSQSAVGLTQAPQLLSSWVPSLSPVVCLIFRGQGLGNFLKLVLRCCCAEVSKTRVPFTAKALWWTGGFFTLGVPMPLTSPTAMKSFAFASLGQLSARFWRGCPHICRRASFGMVLDGTGGYMCCPLAWERVLL